MISKSRVAACIFAVLASSAFVKGAPSVFDFRNTTSGIGVNLDGLTTGSATVGGITLTATLFPDGVFNQTGSAFGINAASGTDDTDEFDPGEGFTFSFSTHVILNSITVSSFGTTSSGLVSFNGGSAIASISSTGITSLSSTFVTAGTILRFASNSADISLASSDFSLDSLTVTSVPEPSAFALLGGLAAVGFVASRRRRPSA